MAIKNMSARLVDVGGVCNPVTGGVGQAVDGQTVAVGDDVLLPTPPNGNAYAGEWIAAAGAWTRATDWDTVGEMEVGDNWTIREGSLYENTVWAFEAPVAPATINVTTLTIGMRSHRRAIEEGGGIDISGTTPPIISWRNPTDLQSTFIEGLRIEYLSANSLRVKAGAAYIPQTGVADMALDVDLTGLVLTASTWYYLYAYDAGGGVLAVDPPSTQVPATPYRGRARAKGPDGTPDQTRRFLGSIYATASNTMRRFTRVRDDQCQWQGTSTGIGLGALNAAAAGYEAVSIASLQPPTSHAVNIWATHRNTTASTNLFVIGGDDSGATLGGTEDTYFQTETVSGATATRQGAYGTIVVGNQTLRYRATGAGASNFIFIQAYHEGR